MSKARKWCWPQLQTEPCQERRVPRDVYLGHALHHDHVLQVQPLLLEGDHLILLCCQLCLMPLQGTRSYRAQLTQLDLQKTAFTWGQRHSHKGTQEESCGTNKA